LSPILFKLYGKYLTKEASEGSRDFEITGQAIRTVKYANDLVLVTKENVVLQSMTERLTEIGRCYGMGSNVPKAKVMRISRQLFPIQIMIDKKQLDNIEYFNYLGNMITNDARCTWEIKFKIAMAKAAFNNKKIILTSITDLNLRKKLVKCYNWSTALYDVETWTILETDQKYLGRFEMWCWRRMEKMSWTNHVRNGKELHTARRRGISYTQHV